MPSTGFPDGRLPVLLSAHEEDLVSQDAAAILAYLDREPSVASVSGVAATLLRIRRIRRHRALVRACDRDELAAGLGALADGHEHALVTRSSVSGALRMAFVFPGQGNQWPSMGADAYRLLPSYQAEADRCAAAFAAAGLPSPLPYLLTDADSNWPQIQIQGAQFTHSVSLAQVWRSCGVLPDITVGHSLGEAAAAYVAGSLALADAVAVVGARATVVEGLAGRYGMAVLGVDADEAGRFMVETPGWLEISAVNGTSSTVVSGDRDAVDAVVGLAEQHGVFARALAVDYPGHTSALEPLRTKFEQLLPDSAFLDAPVEFVSSTVGAVVETDTDFNGYWYRNLRGPVRFDRAVAVALHRGANAFVELSAHPSLLSSLADLVDDESTVIVGSGSRGEPITDQLSANIAVAALADPGYRWADVAGVSGHAPLSGFPNSPMRATHFWATRERLSPTPGAGLTVAAEEWAPFTFAAVAGTGCAIAVCESCPTESPPIESPPIQSPLARQLKETVAAHPDCQLTEPDEAAIAVVIAPALEQADAAGAAEEIIKSGRLDYGRVVGPHCRRVWLVTAGAEHVHRGDPAALPAQAALAAMHRSAGFEFTDQAFGHVDLPSRDVGVDDAAACVNVLLGEAAEVALRDSASGRPRCYTRVLCERREPMTSPLDGAALDDAVFDNVVITGGNGAIGLAYARYCIDRGARRVILLSRNGMHPAELDRLTDGRDADVRAPQCDITDSDALSDVAAKHAGEGASLLIHAAGAARFGTLDQLTDVDFADVFGAKVAGLVRITERWPLRPDVRIMLCSSISSVWGGYGHAAYAASNRILDVLAAQLRANGLDCTAVRWGLWQDTGIASSGEIARVERSGLVAMDPVQAVIAGFQQHEGDPLILAADFARLRLFFESQGLAMPFTAPAGAPEPDRVCDEVARRPVAEVVRTEVAALLGVGDPASLDLNEALVDLGVDSLLAVDLRKRLRRQIGRAAPLARLLGGITGKELIDVLQDGGPDGRSPAGQEGPARPRTATTPATSPE